MLAGVNGMRLNDLEKVNINDWRHLFYKISLIVCHDTDTVKDAAKHAYAIGYKQYFYH